LALQIGTASFGNSYGIMNHKILDDVQEIERIIELCSKKDLILDSSPNYGLSLNIINEIARDFEIKVNTKIVIGNDTLIEFEKKLCAHLNQLSNCFINTIYFHEPKASLNNKFRDYSIKMREICNDFGVKKIGLSIYTKNDIRESILNENIINCLQIPVNILDKNNISFKKNFSHIDLIARSVFIQGLLTTKGINLLENSTNQNDKKNAFLIRKLCKNFNINIEMLAIATVLSLKEIDDIIIGINSFKQLEEILEYYRNSKIIVKQIQKFPNLYNEIDSDGSVFRRWLPILSNKIKNINN
tara:strand:- start:34 stop:933 length:900 start_codon:yes stop_codon:yes gene_type:complete